MPGTLTSLPNLASSFGLLKLSIDLMNINHDSIFAESVRQGAKDNLRETIQMIKDQAADNYPLTCDIIGYELLNRVMLA